MKTLFVVAEMIKVEHTVFALPFAFLGALLAASGCPTWVQSFWILLAMVGARSSAMAFNRLVDRRFDQMNPRTQTRALPMGLISPSRVVALATAAALVFFVAAWNLNRLAFLLSPLALTIVLFYSFTKRFTAFSHLFLGLSLAIAPIGGWVAIRGSLDWFPFFLALAVLFWVAGFDIIYACQDIHFDRGSGLHSLPARFGVSRALQISTFFHGLMVALLGGVIYFAHLSWLSWVGWLLVSVSLIYEHHLVQPDDLSRVNSAFFTVNGVISIVLVIFVGVDICQFA